MPAYVGHNDTAWDAERVLWITPEEAFEEFGPEDGAGSLDVGVADNPDRRWTGREGAHLKFKEQLIETLSSREERFYSRELPIVVRESTAEVHRLHVGQSIPADTPAVQRAILGLAATKGVRSPRIRRSGWHRTAQSKRWRACRNLPRVPCVRSR